MTKYTAMLTSGRSFVLLVAGADPKSPTEHSFKKDVPVVVSEEIKTLLEERAVEETSVKRGGKTKSEKRGKFEFKKVDEAPRQRPAPVQKPQTAS